MNANWTKPFHGITHLGSLRDQRRVTVTEYAGFAELTKWFEGCGFRPIEHTFATVEEAKSAGEAWLGELATR